MNLVPVFIIVLLIFVAGYFLLKDSIRLPWVRRDNTIEVRRLSNFPTNFGVTVDNSKKYDKQRAVIKSEADLRAFLAKVMGGELNSADETVVKETLSKVNFDKEYLLGVATNVVDTTGGTLRVKRVLIDNKNNSLIVNMIQTQPSKECVVEVQNNVLVDIVAISKTDKPIQFEISKEMKTCN